MSVIGFLHGSLVHSRRVEVLSEHVSRLMPRHASVLDVGCGDGLLAATIAQRRPDLAISGIDVLARADTHVPVTRFDGTTIPFDDRSFDAVLFVDVLHHTADPLVLLREARRVTRDAIIIKDHSREGFLAGATLKGMDWIGNARHGVALPYNYWTPVQWQRAVSDLGMRAIVWEKDLRLYPAMTRWIFDRSLHFVALLSAR
jgi:SAM-dependent methyltransferase